MSNNSVPLQTLALNNVQPGHPRTDRLLLAIIGTVLGLAAIDAALFWYWGPGPVLSETPWYIPVMHSFTALAGFSVAFLALGRHRVLHDPASYWIGIAFAAFGIEATFYILSWPGLLPNGQAVIARLPSTSAWIALLELATVSVLLLIAGLGQGPVDSVQSARHWRRSAILWLIGVGLVCGLTVAFEQSLPPLVGTTGSLVPFLLTLDWGFMLLFILGAIVSTGRYLQTRDSLYGYIALAQTCIAFVIITVLIGGRRFDLWFYWSRILLAGGFISLLFGLLSEYVGLFDRERDKTRALQARSAELMGVLQSSPEAIFVTDESGGVRLANRRALALLGVEKVEEISHPPADWAARYQIRDQRGRMLSAPDLALARVGRGESFQNVESQLLNPNDGSVTWLLTSGRPLHDESGKYIGGIVIATDISDLKRVEEALRTSEEQYRALFESMSEGFEIDELIWDEQGRPIDYTVLQVNPAYEIESGLQREKVTGRRASEILPVVAPVWLERFGEVVATGQPTRFEEYSVSLRRWLEIYAYSLHDGNRFAVLSRDITARKQAEVEREDLLSRAQAARALAEQNAQQLARLQEVAAALAGALTLEQVGEVVMAQGLSALGASSGSLVLLDEATQQLNILRSAGLEVEQEKNWSSFPLSAPAPLAEAIRQNQVILIESVEEFERRYPLTAKGRQARHKMWLALPLNVSGRIIGGIGLSFTETRAFNGAEEKMAVTFAQQCAQALERARLYQAEQQARAEAEAAVQIRDQFISVASHELKTPLTTIKGYAELVVQRSEQLHLDEALQRMLSTINVQSGRLEKMIYVLLDISRIERGQLALELEPVDLDALLQCVVDDLQPTLRKHTLEFKSRGGRFLIKGDESRLEQVLQNLVQNAVKYSPMGGPIEVELSRVNGTAQIAITDQGIGIPKADLPRLFTRFYRAQNAEAFHISGLGVGLYVVREIVRLHGGEITVESKEGKGSTFRVILPLRAKH